VVASAFAAAWARRLGHSVVVRRLSSGWPCAPAWVVSVPLAVWGLSPAHGQVLVAGGGGVRGVASALRALGLVSASAEVGIAGAAGVGSSLPALPQESTIDRYT